MITRDKDDPRNKEEGETGPGGVRMVVAADMFNDMTRFHEQMLRPGSPMAEELSKMKVRRADELKGCVGLGPWISSLGLTSAPDASHCCFLPCLTPAGG